MKLGMNHPMGPLTLADFIGLDVCVAILDVLHEGLGDPKYRACPLLRRMVAAGHLGRKIGPRLLPLRVDGFADRPSGIGRRSAFGQCDAPSAVGVSRVEVLVRCQIARAIGLR